MRSRQSSSSRREQVCIRERVSSAVVGDRVPGTAGTSQPLIRGTVCVGLCVREHMWHDVSQPFGYARRPSDTIIITSAHQLAHSHSARSQRATQAGRQTGLARPHAAAVESAERGTATPIIRALTSRSERGRRGEPGFSPSFSNTCTNPDWSSMIR